MSFPVADAAVTNAMRRALSLAEAQLGRTAPNPTVGCVVLDARDEIVGEGATGDGGRPHAEERALEAAALNARGGTVVVTLEPCAARSSGSMSCSERIVAAGAARVVASMEDPHDNARGQGFKSLREAGLVVEVGLGADEARRINRGFFWVVEKGRPYVAAARDARAFDCDWGFRERRNPEAELSRLADTGVTRVRVAPGSALANQLTMMGLLDARE